MRREREDLKVRSVSFSGIDGAGKSTQIRALCDGLSERGLKVRVIPFWDQVATLTRFREGAGHRILKGEKGVGSPSAPVNRRDKNVESRLMTMARLFFYSVDAASVCLVMRKAQFGDEDVIVFDRYIFDEFANLNLQSRVIRIYIRLLMSFVPRPDVCLILDADPAQARARKPEYPINFLYTNKSRYLQLDGLVGGMTVVAPGSFPQVQKEILEQVLNVAGASCI